VELALVVFCVNKGGDNAVDNIVLGATRNEYSTTAALVTFHYLWIVESQITHSPPIGILRVLGERRAAKTACSLSPCLESAEVRNCIWARRLLRLDLRQLCSFAPLFDGGGGGLEVDTGPHFLEATVIKVAQQ
jgi:hypothetical protein